MQTLFLFDCQFLSNLTNLSLLSHFEGTKVSYCVCTISINLSLLKNCIRPNYKIDLFILQNIFYILLNQIVLSHEWPRVSPGTVFAHSRPTPSLKPEKVEIKQSLGFHIFHIYFAYILDIFYIYCTYISKVWRVVLICLKSSTFIEAVLLRANEVLSWFQTNMIFLSSSCQEHNSNQIDF